MIAHDPTHAKFVDLVERLSVADQEVLVEVMGRLDHRARTYEATLNVIADFFEGLRGALPGPLGEKFELLRAEVRRILESA